MSFDISKGCLRETMRLVLLPNMLDEMPSINESLEQRPVVLPNMLDEMPSINESLKQRPVVLRNELDEMSHICECLKQMAVTMQKMMLRVNELQKQGDDIRMWLEYYLKHGNDTGLIWVNREEGIIRIPLETFGNSRGGGAFEDMLKLWAFFTGRFHEGDDWSDRCQEFRILFAKELDKNPYIIKRTGSCAKGIKGDEQYIFVEQKRGFSTALPKYPGYAPNIKRENSYSQWSCASAHTPKEFAEAGFYYTGIEDCVRCFSCGIGLRHWDQDNNVWIEHARWSRKCEFLKQKKGQEFIDRVQLDEQVLEETEAGRQAGNDGCQADGSTQEDERDLNIDDLRRENERLKELMTCKVCHIRNADVILIPCGHMCTCGQCAPGIHNCPMCGQEVKGKIKAILTTADAHIRAERQRG